MAERVGPLVTSRRQLISDISHELRSPLARINATLGLARQRLGQNVLFDRLERDAERLNEMVGRLLTLARLQTPTTSSEMRRIDLKDARCGHGRGRTMGGPRARMPRRVRV